MRGTWTLIAGALAALMLTTLARAHDTQQGGLRVHEPWARATIGVGKTAAAYLTVINQGTVADRLIGIATPVAESAMLHTSVMGEDGVMKMRPVAAIEVPAGGEVKLEPGGLHIMLMGVHEPLKAGKHFPLTLSFERAGEFEVTVPIADIAAVSSDHGGDSHESEETDDADAQDRGQTVDTTDEETAAGAVVAQKAPQQVIDVRIENRQVVAPEAAIRITEGDLVELRWTSDEAVELHLHGYDIELEVKPGEPASMVVEAYATGRFPITSHGWGDGGHSEDTLIYLEVYPK
ncbi:MAG TPA: copper chaperone PCu(A)C [Kiloniellales bacterium]